jgi:hypothetical protein
MSTEEKRQRLSPLLRRLLVLKVWLIEKFRFGERQVTLVWAAVIGILGALVTECFRRATDLLHFLFTGSEATIITSFERLPLWQRFLVPVIGGILAGLTLWIGNRLIASVRQKSTTDYMEAVLVGTGIISLRASLVKTIFCRFRSIRIARDQRFSSLVGIGDARRGQQRTFDLDIMYILRVGDAGLFETSANCCRDLEHLGHRPYLFGSDLTSPLDP